MEFAEAIQNLKQRLADARRSSLEGGFELSEAMLEQVATEAEKFRKECLRQADQLENQARACKWQADAYSAVSAMVYKIFNGFVSAEEKRQAEMKAREEELAEKEQEKEKEESVVTSTLPPPVPTSYQKKEKKY